VENKTFKVALAIGLAALFAALVLFFVVRVDSGSGSNSDSFFPIWISLVPIWISVGIGAQEKRKRDEKAKRKQKETIYDYAEDEDYLEDKVLSAYDGEIVGYDEAEEEKHMRR